MSRFSPLLVALSLVLGISLVSAVPATATVTAPSSVGQSSPVVTSLAAKPRKKRWKAPNGPFFNDPHRKAGHFAIERKIIETIRHTKRGAIIRIAVYSFDRVPVANALVAAHKRGVKVQMLLNDHLETRAIQLVRAEVGKNRNKKSFIYKCVASCRSTQNEYNNLHSKFYSFSKAGRQRDVIAVGSANLMLNAALHQWNDLYFSHGDHELFRQYVSLFNNMKKDWDVRRPPRFFCGTPTGAVCDDSVDKHTVWAFPRLSGPKNDLVLDMLNKIQCVTPDAAGNPVRTKLALSMHTMRGRRGDYLAAAIRNKFAEGCDFRVSYGLIGYHTKQILGAPTARGRIPLRSTGMDYNTDDDYDLNKDGEDDLILDYYSHQKYFVIQGTYNGVQGTNMVLTGSSNWASLSTANDELWMTIQGARVAKKYLKNFNYQWDLTRNSRDAYTTTYAEFRVRTDDGRWTTVRRPVTTVEPDRYATGPYWESD
ncbi:phospholipase D-like domain-containing protein [Nocardioides KLBMP 9356]|uniref:phospholipase D n=1 Tax=Nocardioides potassii TaxID=2911371 RepID=A0ABS9HGL1_9ACTN|nr:phospholipase D-like domain-containing protein [Nocardioides potassii]MCF6379512.1 phospholipase D-like domain-containing protein [Nocardioides potassii]